MPGTYELGVNDRELVSEQTIELNAGSAQEELTVVLADLVRGVTFMRPGDEGDDSPTAARLKGEERMSDLIDNAVADRERPLRDDVVLPFGSGYVRLRAQESARIVKQARRRFKRHNAGRRYVENEVWSAMAATVRDPEVGPKQVKDALRGTDDGRRILDSMWPVLTPAQLLHDLFGSKALLKLAARDVLSETEALALFRSRSETVEDVRWTSADVALLDDAFDVLGPKPGKGGKPHGNRDRQQPAQASAPAPRAKPLDPDSPFAKLAALKEQMGK